MRPRRTARPRHDRETGGLHEHREPVATAATTSSSSAAATTDWWRLSTLLARGSARWSWSVARWSAAWPSPRSSRPASGHPPGAYVLAMLGEHIWRDMRLAERGLHVDAVRPQPQRLPRRRPLLDGGARRRRGRERWRASRRRTPPPTRGSTSGSHARSPSWFGPLFGLTPPDLRHADALPILRRLARLGGHGAQEPQDAARRLLPHDGLERDVPRRALRVRRSQGGTRLVLDQRLGVGTLDAGHRLHAAARVRFVRGRRRRAQVGLRARRHRRPRQAHGRCRPRGRR